MENQRFTNFLLTTIALCLVLIVAKLYTDDFVPPAHAQTNPSVVSLVYHDGNQFQPALDRSGRLAIKQNP
jgi:hypothetical protein